MGQLEQRILLWMINNEIQMKHTLCIRILKIESAGCYITRAFYFVCPAKLGTT